MVNDTITILLRRNLPPVEVPVLDRVGPLAVHQTVYPQDSRPRKPMPLTVSHAQTGLAICFTLTQERALEAATALQGLDWAYDTPEAISPTTETEALKIVRRLIRAGVCMGKMPRRAARPTVPSTPTKE